MDVCSGSQARSRADGTEIALQVLCHAFVFCGDAFPLLFAFLALLQRLELFGCLDLSGCLDVFGSRAAYDNQRQQSHGTAFTHSDQVAVKTS
jgi:hypothetical protein